MEGKGRKERRGKEWKQRDGRVGKTPTEIKISGYGLVQKCSASNS